MRHFELLFENYRLNTGETVVFSREENVEQENRGFVRDDVHAYSENEKIGRLSLDYIPRENLSQFYPNIFAYMSQIGGKGILPFGHENARLDDLSLDELQAAAHRYYYHNRRRGVEFVSADRNQLLAYLKRLERTLNRGEVGEAFRKFIRHNVDRPRVGWIEVSDAFKGRGVGRALYVEGSRWMASKGLHLYASTLQSESAKTAWAAMERLGMVSTDSGGRRYLNVK